MSTISKFWPLLLLLLGIFIFTQNASVAQAVTLPDAVQQDVNNPQASEKIVLAAGVFGAYKACSNM